MSAAGDMVETTQGVKGKVFARNRRDGRELRKGNRKASPELTIPW